MIRALLLTVAAGAGALSLSACASNANYGLQDGDANYDALKKATEDCKARGGHIELKSGGDTKELSDYECKMGKGT
jgi:hypothetical protein